MKRWIVIVVGLATAALGGAALWNICSHRVVKSELSEVYNRYKDRSDLRVAFVKDYRIDDSATVDVTTLTAKDSASWENLLREMNYPEMLIKIMNENLRNGNRGVGNYYCKKGLPETRTKIDVPNSQLVIVSPFEKCFYIFDVISKEQAHLIMDFEREDIIHQKK